MKKHYYFDNGKIKYNIPAKLYHDFLTAGKEHYKKHTPWHEIYTFICGVEINWNAHKSMEDVLEPFAVWFDTPTDAFTQSIKAIMLDFSKDYIWEEITLVELDLAVDLDMELRLKGKLA
jgi:hypothetical protein